MAPSPKDRGQAPQHPDQKDAEVGIPQLYWGLRVEEVISTIIDPRKKEELQAELDRYYALLQLQGLYE